MSVYRYSEWDGRQDFPDLDADWLIGELERHLTAYGDLATALWKMQREGIEDGAGNRLPGNRALFQRLEEARQALMERYALATAVKNIRQQLDRVLHTEGIANLTEDLPGQVETLKQHQFTSPEAAREFQQFLESLSANSLMPRGGEGQRQTSTGKGIAGEMTRFSGREAISYAGVLEMIALLKKMEMLEQQLRANQHQRSLGALDTGLVRELMGNETALALERLRRIDTVLAAAGYMRHTDREPQLTSRGIRAIGQKALAEVFNQWRRNGSGNHAQRSPGNGGMELEETKKFEFGDTLNLHLLNTIKNSLLRSPGQPPLTLTPDDFEIMRMESLRRSATVLMLDLSRSMPRRGNFQAAKRVALALGELIKSCYARDTLYVVGFSTSARLIEWESLPAIDWDSRDRYTNIQHALRLGRKLLARESSAVKQILLVTDGEPTAHNEGDRVFTGVPTSQRTRQRTLAEVKNCTDEGITINIFLLEGAGEALPFVQAMARLNRGRVFQTNARTLGKYLLVDYIASRSRVIQ